MQKIRQATSLTSADTKLATDVADKRMPLRIRFVDKMDAALTWRQIAMLAKGALSDFGIQKLDERESGIGRKRQKPQPEAYDRFGRGV